MLLPGGLDTNPMPDVSGLFGGALAGALPALGFSSSVGGGAGSLFDGMY